MMLTKPATLLTTLLAATLLTGCQALSGWTYSSGPEFRPNADGPAAVIGATAVIPGLHLAYVGQTGTPGAFGPGLARFNGTGLEAFSVDGSLDPEITAGSQRGFFWRETNTYGGTSNRPTGVGTTDGVVAVGSWFARNDIWGRPFVAETRGNLVPWGELAYAIGQLTPPASLPQSGMARYQISASTYHDYYSSASGGLSVLWGGAGSKVGLDLNLFPCTDCRPDYHLLSTGGLDNPSLSEISVRSGTATFAGSGIPVPECKGAGCQAEVEGFFAGPGADHAGLTYRATDSTGWVEVGAAAFALTEFTPAQTPTPTPTPAGPVVLSAPAATTIAYAMNDFGLGIEGPGAAMQAADTQLNGYSLTASPAFFAPQRGTATTAEGGGDSLITWGRWTGGTFTGPLSLLAESDPRRTFNANQGLHYVVGAETPVGSLPLSGTATFSLLGATRPTWGDGALAPGTFTGSMAVQWGGASSTMVGANFSVAMPGDATYSIVTNGGLANPAASEIAIVAGTARFSGFLQAPNPGGRAQYSAFCDARVSGFFAGPAAERAGIAYTVGLGGSTAISGAAAFKKQ